MMMMVMTWRIMMMMMMMMMMMRPQEAWSVEVVIAAVPLLPAEIHWGFYGQKGNDDHDDNDNGNDDDDSDDDDDEDDDDDDEDDDATVAWSVEVLMAAVPLLRAAFHGVVVQVSAFIQVFCLLEVIETAVTTHSLSGQHRRVDSWDSVLH